MGTKVLPVAQLAEYFSIWGVTTGHGVQGSLAVHAGETCLVETVILGQHLLCMEHLPSAPGTCLLVFCVSLDCTCIKHQRGTVSNA